MNSLSFAEWAAFSANALICVVLLVWLYVSSDRVNFWSPPLFVAAIFLYYVVIGPLVARMFGDGVDRKVLMLPYYLPAWIGAGVGLVSWLAGYVLRGRSAKDIADARNAAAPNFLAAGEMWRLSITFNIVGMVSFILTNGLDVFRLVGFTPPDILSRFIYSGSFSNYLGLAVNFLIPGCAILFLLRLRGFGNWRGVILWCAVAMITYTSLGFRYRLVLLASALMFVYYLCRRSRPNILLLLGGTTVFVVVMGFIGNTRTYGSGLEYSRNQQNMAGSLLSGFGEATIFATSGAVITHVPRDRPLVWAEPIIQSLLMPIPSGIYKSKASNAYMNQTLITIYGDLDYMGAAYMFFAETYQAFWWPGLILAHFSLGWLCRWLWEWYRARQQNPLALLVYASSAPFLYVVFSRGYLPQVCFLFAYSVLPAVALYRWPQRVLRFAPKFGGKFGPPGGGFNRRLTLQPAQAAHGRRQVRPRAHLNR